MVALILDPLLFASVVIIFVERRIIYEWKSDVSKLSNLKTNQLHFVTFKSCSKALRNFFLFDIPTLLLTLLSLIGLWRWRDVRSIYQLTDLTVRRQMAFDTCVSVYLDLFSVIAVACIFAIGWYWKQFKLKSENTFRMTYHSVVFYYAWKSISISPAMILMALLMLSPIRFNQVKNIFKFSGENDVKSVYRVAMSLLLVSICDILAILLFMVCFTRFRYLKSASTTISAAISLSQMPFDSTSGSTYSFDLDQNLEPHLFLLLDASNAFSANAIDIFKLASFIFLFVTVWRFPLLCRNLNKYGWHLRVFRLVLSIWVSDLPYVGLMIATLWRLPIVIRSMFSVKKKNGREKFFNRSSIKLPKLSKKKTDGLSQTNHL